MPTWLKLVLLIIFGAVVLIAAAALLTIHQSHATRARLVEAGADIRREGVAFGRGRDAGECIDESVRRLRGSRAFQGEVRARLFLNGCLSVAVAPPAFCESVPKLTESASAEWAVNECRNRDADEISRCSRVMQEVVSYCDHSRLQRPPIGQTPK